MFFAQFIFAQNTGIIQIGNGSQTTSAGSTSIPVTNYDYSYTQQIITAAEYAAAGGFSGTITKILFKPSTIGTYSDWNDLEIFIGNTTKTSFTSNTDFVPYADLTQVSTGGAITPTPIGGQWFEINFSTPFTYTGGNIVVAVHDKAYGYNYDTAFYTYNSASNTGIVFRRDDTDITVATFDATTQDSWSLARVSILPQIRFFGNVAACIAPLDVTITPTTNGGTATWAATIGAVDYSWKVVANNAGPNATPIASGTGAASAVFTGLDPATDYDFYVKSNCGATNGESSWSFAFDFTTSCAPITNSFYQSFDSTPVGDYLTPSVPVCWNFIYPGYINWDSGYGYVADFDALSDPNCFYFSNAGDFTSDFILVGPETVNLGNGLKQVRFSAKRDEWSTSVLTVGTMSDPTSAATFTALPGAAIQLTPNYIEYTFTLPVGTNDYFAFKLQGEEYYSSIFIDNVYYEDIPSCAPVEPISVQITNVTNNQAVLNWVSNETSFDIEWGPIGFTQGAGTLLQNVANNYLLANLSDYTEYSFYVRANCDSSQSTWRGPFSFRTQKLVTSPWYEGFATSNLPEGFTSSNFYIYNFVDGIAETTSNFLRANLYSFNPNAEFSTLNVGPILAGDQLMFKYSLAWYFSGDMLSSDAANFEVQISTDFGANYSTIATLNSNNIVGWQTFQMSLAPYVGQKIKLRFVATWEDNGDYPDYNLTFDDLFIGACLIPATPVISNTTINSATINVEGLPTDNYEIEYGVQGFTQGTGTIVNFTGVSHTISGLNSGTRYEFYIRRNCGTSYSPQIGKFKFSTACLVFDNAFTENFDTTESGSDMNQTVPICWSFLDEGSGTGYVYESNYDSFTPPNSFYMNNYYENAGDYILISPETNNLGNGYYRVSFKAKGGSAGYKLKFGTMSDKLDATTFTEIQEFTLDSNYDQTYVVYLPITTNDYFAFKHGLGATYRSIYIDNVVYDLIPACAPPINLNANKDFTNLSAELTWTGPEVSTDNNFQVQWGVAGFTLGTGTIVNTTSLSTTVSNLTFGSSYSFYVRRVCGSDNSEWIGPYTFDMNYCTSAPSSVDGDGITNVTVAGVSMDSTTGASYLDFTNHVISFNAGELVPASVTFDTGYSYDTNIWIDLNNDGVFDNATELLFDGESTNAEPSTLNTSFTVPLNPDNVSGDYKMRIGTADSGQSTPTPCYNGSWGVTVDLNVTINFPCLQPTNIEFTDIGYTYVVIDWDGQGDTDFEIEYGPVGFAQGTGTVVTNVTKPYTLNGLTSGADYNVYVRKNCLNGNSPWSTVSLVHVYCDTPEPTGAIEQTLIQDEPLSNLVINGQNLKYYTNPDLTQYVLPNFEIQTSGTYFVTQTINCESDSYLIVNVTVIPRIARPIVNTNQNFCDGGNISDIQVTSLPGATVYWYSSATSTTPLALDTVLATGTYYVLQTDGVTTSHRVMVNVTVNPTPVDLVSQQIHLCGTYTVSSIAINNTPGSLVKWYTSETATTPLGANSIVTSGTYYLTQSNGTCESNRVAFVVSQFDALDKPTALTQTFCGSGTVADLEASGVFGAQFLWYSTATAATPLASSAALSTGTYYVAQTANGCFSDRRAVAVRVVSLTAPQVEPIVICGSGTVADLYIPAASGTTFKWFNSLSSTEELSQTTPLQTGTYYVSRVQSGCESSKGAVNVTVASVPNAPTGVSQQTFTEGATIANLTLNQSNVIWYGTYADSQNGTNPLPNYMPLVDGSTYYAVVIGSNGCPSLPFAVTVHVVLGNDEFVKDELKFYPNPVVDLLSISYSDIITQVEVFDILGKRVKSIKTDDRKVEVDMSDLASGTYMVQLKTDSKQQFIKIIKK